MSKAEAEITSSQIEPAEVAAPTEALEEPPPFLGTWKRVYGFLVVELAVLVVFFYLLTRWAS